LARIANAAQEILVSGKYDGAIWTEGSPRIEETIYWLNLLVDTTVPICGNAAQRMHGMISNDGPRNIIDSVDHIASRVWADAQGRNQAGAVLIQEQRVFAARTVQKADARPGGYVATGEHGGILGAAGHDGPPLLHYLPTARVVSGKFCKSRCADGHGMRVMWQSPGSFGEDAHHDQEAG
jgi:L-asparaginase